MVYRNKEEELLERIKDLEEKVKSLGKCNHEYETVGGKNINFVHYYNGTNCYIRCKKCGYRKRC